MSFLMRMRGKPVSTTRLRSKRIAGRFPSVEMLEDRCVPTAYTVNSLLDSNIGVGDAGTLRYVLNLANLNHTGTAAVPDTIQFATGGGAINVGALTAGAALPALANNEVAILDGATEAGFAGVPLVTIDGSQATAVPDSNGLTISGGSSTVKALAIVNFSGNGIQLDTNGANIILSCFIGITTAGIAAPNASNGIFLNNVSGNTIGSTSAIGSADGSGGNVISGNQEAGVFVEGTATTGGNNLIEGNFIGTDATGSVAVGNGLAGVAIEASSGNTIGGVTLTTRNLISGNHGSGIIIEQTASTANIVEGNYLGIDVTGEKALPNDDSGVTITSAASNVIGGVTDGSRNVLSGNKNAGVLITSFLAAPVVDPPTQSVGGTLPNGTHFYKVTALTAAGETVGSDEVSIDVTGLNGTVNLTWSFRGGATGYKVYSGTTSGGENDLIATIGDAHVNFFSDIGAPGSPDVPPVNNTAFSGTADANTVQGNFIGLNKGGFLGIGNVFSGVQVFASTNTIIGGVTAAARNIISGNGGAVDSGNGIILQGIATTGSVIQGNYIGTASEGTQRVGNAANGIFIEGASNALIGGTTAGAGNVISSNASADIFEGGISIDEAAHDITIQGNFIGTDVSGATNVGNAFAGVIIGGGSHDILLGGTVAAARNIISGNGFGSAGPAPGVFITDVGTTNIQVVGNYIGTDFTGNLPIGNSLAGVLLVDGTAANIIGGAAAGAGNLISGSVGTSGTGFFGDGILIRASTGNTIQGNRIGTTASGTAALPNHGNGINLFEDAANNQIGGTVPGAGNLISGNGANGILVQDPGSSGVVVQGNLVGTNATASAALPNQNSGVVFQAAIGGVIGAAATGAGNTISGNMGYGLLITSLLPAPLLSPAAALATGSLPAGQYFYVVTTTTATGESTASNEVEATRIDDGHVALSWIAVGGATGYKIYRGSMPGGENVLVATVVGENTTSFDDTGAATTPGTPPALNTAAAAGAMNAQVQGNFIGTNTGGTSGIGNGLAGLAIIQASGSSVGGSSSGAGNIISSNRGDGVLISGAGAQQNVLIDNFIGTDVTGSLGLGNAGNGLELTSGATLNTIGGITPTGSLKDAPPTPPKPPDGNIISGNGANGVLITNGSTSNSFSGNYIGAQISGVAGLGNALDGIAVLNGSNLNSFTGAVFPDNPFIYLNLVVSNGGNGMRIHNSNGTIVQANSFGLAMDNATNLGNKLDGVLIEGSSDSTKFGGVIPLGNISAGNGRNGVEIADTASNTVCFNTFAGTGAFTDLSIPNVLDGFLITSSGAGNELRTNVISGNGANGIHLSGNASGVLVTEAIIGLTTHDDGPLPNGANGILIDGNAHDNIIGGTQASVIPQNTIGFNGANGIAIVGNAMNNSIVNNYIGTLGLGTSAAPNGGAGIFVGGSAKGTIIGSTVTGTVNLISGNSGGGILVSGQSQGTKILANFIGTDPTGFLPLGNLGNGITITTSGNTVGGTTVGQGNLIAFNTQSGVVIDVGQNNSILSNSIFSNGAPGIALISGGNANQPAPVLTVAYQPTQGKLQVAGFLTGTPNTAYTVQVFDSATAAPGQAQNLVGAITVTTDADGTVPFVFSGTLRAGLGAAITATATSASNNTSAISNAVRLNSNANTLYVSSLYGLLLNRIPDPGASSWINALDNGATPASVVFGIESTQEYLSDQVVAIYVHYLNRQPDPVGETFWTTFLTAGGTFEQLAEGLTTSPEYFQNNGGTNTGFVTALYQDVLSRTPSQAELDGWVNALNNGASRLSVSVAFLTSTEYRTNLITLDYNLYLGRNPDPTGLAGWLTALNNGATDQMVLAGILGSPEGFTKWS
jgi:hypothetical protein